MEGQGVDFDGSAYQTTLSGGPETELIRLDTLALSRGIGPGWRSVDVC